MGKEGNSSTPRLCDSEWYGQGPRLSYRGCQVRRHGEKCASHTTRRCRDATTLIHSLGPTLNTSPFPSTFSARFLVPASPLAPRKKKGDLPLYNSQRVLRSCPSPRPYVYYREARPYQHEPVAAVSPQEVLLHPKGWHRV